MINYKLAKEIGATHYAGGEPLSYYKLTDFDLLYFNDCIGEYQLSNNSSSWVARNLKPIPPNHTRTEYEKVTESIFDLRDEFERGELYQKCSTFKAIGGIQELATCINVGNIYRKVEKEIDERQEFVKEASKIWNRDDMHCSTDIFREMYDSGKFKFIG